MSTKTNPCPFCWNTDTGMSMQQIDNLCTQYSIDCHLCLACGPWSPTEDEAIRLWNAYDQLDRIAELEKALGKYGLHGGKCNFIFTMGREVCDCGLGEAIKGKEAKHGT